MNKVYENSAAKASLGGIAMDEIAVPPRDIPNIVVFPPVNLAATIVLGIALQWLMPLGLLASIDQTWRIIFGAVALIAGVLIAFNGRRTLVRLGTNVNPLLPTTTLATEGIYRWTRNPLYVGGVLVMIALALVFALDWLIVLLVPSLLILHFGIVLREELYLERKFGDQYQSYKARVPRYVWPL